MDSSGIVKSVMGDVKAIATNGEERVLQLGERILFNEQIITGDTGTIAIDFSDGTRMDLGRNSNATIDNDSLNAESITKQSAQPLVQAEDEVAAIQQALANDPNFDPSKLDAPAAGGAPATETAGNNGHTAIQVDYLNPQMTPDNGFDTTGINISFLEPHEELLLEARSPAVAVVETPNTTNPELDESAGVNTTASGVLTINGSAAQSVALSAIGATWDAANQTLLANDNSYRVNVNADGTYEVTLLSALTHPQGDGAGNQMVFNIAAELTSDTGIVFQSGFTVSVYDDGPVVNNTQGSINNVVGETLEGLIDYDLGLDGLGSVSLDLPTATYNGDNWDLFSHGDKLSFIVTDADGDNVDELHGFVDVGQAGWDGVGGVDSHVFTLQALENGKGDSAYKLVMHDVLDLPIPVIELNFDHVTVASGNTSAVVFSDAAQTQSEILIESSAIDANGGFVGGGGDNEMNTGDVITYNFGTVMNGAVTQTKLVNDVQLHEVNVIDQGADAFQWSAFKNGLQVGTDSLIFHTAPAGDPTGEFSPKIHVDGGYDTLVITAFGGFQVDGVKYCDCSDIQDIDIHFGFTATDSDSDEVSGDFTVTVGDNISTVIDTNLSVLLSNPDNVDLTV